MVAIDTNIFIDHLRGYNPATKFIESLIFRNDVIFSAITEAELIAGKRCGESSVKEDVLQLLHTWEKIPVSNSIAVLAGDISRDYGLNIADAIIAATALSRKTALLTRNIKDFKNVEGLKVKSPY